MTTGSVLAIAILGLSTAWVLLILYRASADRKGRRQVRGGKGTDGEVRRVAKRRLIVWSAVGYFCLTLLLGWLFFGNRPSTLLEWVVSAGVAAVKTGIFTVLVYATSDYVLDRILPADQASSAEKEHRRE